MKKTLLLLVLSFIFTQQIQSQITTGDLIGVGTSLFGSSKKQKKIEHEKFVIDSTNNALIANKRERELFVSDSIKLEKRKALVLETEKKEKRQQFINDSITKVNNIERANKEIANRIAEEKKKHEWNFEFYKEAPYAFKFNKTLFPYLDADASMDIVTFSDSSKTATVLNSINIHKILPTEIFDMVAYNDDGFSIIKSKKDSKLYVIEKSILFYQKWFAGDDNVTTLITEYLDPKVLTHQTLLLSNYRIKLNDAIGTVNKLEAINNKHLVNIINKYGVVVERRYDTSKFTKLERTTYKQLLQKLEIQKDEIEEGIHQKTGNKDITIESLLSTSDWNKKMRIEHALIDYSSF